MTEPLSEKLSVGTSREYLHDAEGNRAVTQLSRGHIVEAAVEVRSELTHSNRLTANAAGLRVALTNVDMGPRAGSQLWTLEMARYLRDKDAEVLIYTPIVGEVGELAREQGLSVTSIADEATSFKANLVHVQHYPVVREFVDALPLDIPKVNLLHGILPWQEIPMAGSSVTYGCVSIAGKSKAHLLTGTPWGKISIIPNYFDDTRFVEPVLVRNRSALLYSRVANQFTELLQETIRPFGYSLSHIGAGRSTTPRPEDQIREFGLAFAVGRSAIEALSLGLNVILWDDGIIGPAVTSENFWTCVACNFSLQANVLPWVDVSDAIAPQWVARELESATSETSVLDLCRNNLALSNVGPLLVDLYRRVRGEGAAE